MNLLAQALPIETVEGQTPSSSTSEKVKRKFYQYRVEGQVFLLNYRLIFLIRVKYDSDLLDDTKKCVKCNLSQ